MLIVEVYFLQDSQTENTQIQERMHEYLFGPMFRISLSFHFNFFFFCVFVFVLSGNRRVEASILEFLVVHGN